MIAALIALMVQAAAPVPAPSVPPPPATNVPATRAQARLGELFSDEDYPVEARRLHESGTAEFRLDVGSDGLVKHCSLIASSGSVSLDGATCRILTERARFTPARDTQRKPVTDSIVGKITWRFDPARLPPLQPTSLVYTLRSTPAGEVACSITFNNGPPPADADCPVDLRSEVAEAARASGRSEELTEVTIVAPKGEREPVDTANHGVQVYALDVDLKIAPDGTVLECRVARDQGRVAAEGGPADGCIAYRRGAMLYRPIPGAADTRDVTIRMRGYTGSPRPASAVPSRRPGEPARARANLASLFSDDDYPEAAIRNQEAGTVGFQLHVGLDGLVTRCDIISSSGSNTLDSTTCRLLTERARFSPARDRSGQAMTDEVVGRITWRLPQEAPMPVAPTLFVESMVATSTGKVTCTATVNAQAPEIYDCQADDSARLAARARTAAKKVEQYLITTWTPAGQAEPVDRADRGMLIGETRATLTIAADGSVTECRVTLREGRLPGVEPLDPCHEFVPGAAHLFERSAEAGARRVLNVRARAYLRS